MTGIPIVGGGMGGHPSHPTIFLKAYSHIKTDAPHGAPAPHPLKNEAPPHLKNNPPPPPLKREAPFHEMIPRKSTTNNNLKSS